MNVGETSWRLLVTWLIEGEDEGNWTRGWLTVGLREGGKLPSSGGRVCEGSVATFDLPQMRRLRPRKRMWLIHDHISYKGQEGSQSPGPLTSVLCGPPCSHTPLLGRKAETRAQGRVRLSPKPQAVIKAVSSLPSQAPPRGQYQDLKGTGTWTQLFTRSRERMGGAKVLSTPFRMSMEK